MTERWRPVVGHERYYEVSDIGRVRSVDRVITDSKGYSRRLRGRLLRPALNTRRFYWNVSLSRGDRRTNGKLHRLVLEAFVGQCPPGLVGCHNDGNPSNNQLSNLRWDTLSSNSVDSVTHGTHRNANKTHCPQGHPYDKENTLILSHQRGARRCRICYTKQCAEAEARYRQRRRVAS